MQTPQLERRRLAALIAFEALTLAVMSTLHLTGIISHGSGTYDSDGAGIAEGVIGIVLIAAALSLSRFTGRAYRFAQGAVAFAIVGFLIGITVTIQGGTAADITYHATGLPLLGLTLIWLVRGEDAAERA